MPFYNFAIQHNFTKFNQELQDTHAVSHEPRKLQTKKQKPKRH